MICLIILKLLCGNVYKLLLLLSTKVRFFSIHSRQIIFKNSDYSPLWAYKKKDQLSPDWQFSVDKPSLLPSWLISDSVETWTLQPQETFEEGSNHFGTVQLWVSAVRPIHSLGVGASRKCFGSLSAFRSGHRQRIACRKEFVFHGYFLFFLDVSDATGLERRFESNNFNLVPSAVWRIFWSLLSMVKILFHFQIFRTSRSRIARLIPKGVRKARRFASNDFNLGPVPVWRIFVGLPWLKFCFIFRCFGYR